MLTSMTFVITIKNKKILHPSQQQEAGIFLKYTRVALIQVFTVRSDSTGFP
jgi:hypothetical protein